MAEQTTKEGWGTKTWLQLISVLYLAILATFVSWTDPCVVALNTPFWRIDLVYFSCRNTNELGDFLAGSFAPLAFLWLAGAVFIQSKELAEQRKTLKAQVDELELTRRELGLTREAVAAQAEEAKASTGFIRQQTEILKEEQKLNAEVAVDQHIDVLVSAIEKTWMKYKRVDILAAFEEDVPAGIVSGCNLTLIVIPRGSTLEDILSIIDMVSFGKPTFPERITASDITYNLRYDWKKFHFSQNSINIFSETISAIETIQQKIEQASPGKQLEVRDLRLQNVTAKIDNMKEYLEMIKSCKGKFETVPFEGGPIRFD